MAVSGSLSYSSDLPSSGKPAPGFPDSSPSSGALGKVTHWIKSKCQTVVLERQRSTGEWLASLLPSSLPYCPTPTRQSLAVSPAPSGLQKPVPAELKFPDPNPFKRDASHSARKSAPAALLVHRSRTFSEGHPSQESHSGESSSQSSNAKGASHGRQFRASASLGPVRLTAQCRSAGPQYSRREGVRPELHDLFQLMDLDGDGRISAEELACVLRVVGEDCSVGAVQAMIAQADSDGDGLVSLEDFAKVVSVGSPFAATSEKERKLNSTSFGSSVGIPSSSDSMRSVSSIVSEVSHLWSPHGVSSEFGRHRHSAECTNSSEVYMEGKAWRCQSREGEGPPLAGLGSRGAVQERGWVREGGQAKEDKEEQEEEQGSYNLQNLQEAFDMFDCDGNGVICEEDLHATLQGIWGDDVTWDECETIILNADRDGDGVVGFEDFAAAMQGGGFGGALGSRNEPLTQFEKWQK